jgi:V-type H+-transporting ATPase subunit d
MTSEAKAEQENKREMHESAQLIRREGNIGGLTTFNMNFGFLEAVVRGMRSGFLKDFEYRQLTQCENLEDCKLALGDTDYCNVLQNTVKLTPEIMVSRCRDKFIQEFNYLKSQAVGHLASFLEFITYEYLIKSISFVISSLIKGADVETLLNKCHPLGKSSHLKSIMTFENFENADGLVELYRTVLVDTPVAHYFEKYFNMEIKDKGEGSAGIQKVYNEVEIDIIDNMLQKLWLEDFYAYTQTLKGESSIVMKELLEFEADRRAIQITVNSFTSNLNEQQARSSERKQLYCTFGQLYPDATMSKFNNVGNMQQLAQALENYPVYRELLRKAQEGNSSFSDQLLMHEVKLCRAAFDGQSHFACFYAFVKLKIQEERNLRHIFNCIDQKRDAKDIRFINIFKG